MLIHNQYHHNHWHNNKDYDVLSLLVKIGGEDWQGDFHNRGGEHWLPDHHHHHHCDHYHHHHHHLKHHHHHHHCHHHHHHHHYHHQHHHHNQFCSVTSAVLPNCNDNIEKSPTLKFEVA